MKKAAVCGIVMFVSLSCASLGIMPKKPEVSIKKFDIESITLKDITFRFDLELNNPYPIGFKLDDVGLKVTVEGTELLKTRTKKGVTVAAGGSEITPVLLKLDYERIMQFVRNYAEKEYLACVIDMDVVIPLPEMLHALKKNITFDYTVQRSIPALKPSVRIQNVRVEAPTMEEIRRSLATAASREATPEKLFRMFGDLISGSRVDDIALLKSIDVPLTVHFDIEVKNATRARLDFQSLAYDFAVNGEKLIRGETKNISNTPEGSVIRVSNRFSSRALGASILNMFRTRGGSYQFGGFAYLSVPKEIKADPLRLDFGDKGDFSLK